MIKKNIENMWLLFNIQLCNKEWMLDLRIIVKDDNINMEYWKIYIFINGEIPRFHGDENDYSQNGAVYIARVYVSINLLNY